ncbi:MAG: Flp pilus assembly protein CpaB [Tepidisphaeraceae bacterium]
MNLKAWIPLILAVGLGLVALVMAQSLLNRGAAPAADAGPTVPVVIATRNVEPGAALSAEDLTVAKVAPETAPEALYANPDEVVGRVVTTRLVKGQQIVDTLLAPKGTASGIQGMIPEGMRAITVEINETTGVAHMLQPGCRVDVVTTLQDGEEKTVARTVVQNLLITAVGQRLTNGPQTDDDGDGKIQPARSVTLLATPEQAETVELACTVGRPRLVLRGPKDEAANESDGVTLVELRGDKPAKHTDPFLTNLPEQFLRATPPRPAFDTAAPATQPVAMADPEFRSVTIIRAGSESTVKMELPARKQAAPIPTPMPVPTPVSDPAPSPDLMTGTDLNK